MAQCLRCGKAVADGFRYCPFCEMTIEEGGKSDVIHNKRNESVPDGNVLLVIVSFLFVIAGLLLWIGYQTEDVDLADAARKGAYAGLIFRAVLILLTLIFGTMMLLN